MVNVKERYLKNMGIVKAAELLLIAYAVTLCFAPLVYFVVKDMRKKK